MPASALQNESSRSVFAIDRYARSRQIELARSIAGRTKIYLDLNFWIIARDAAAGTRNGPAEKELLELLRQGVADGSLVCPISESTLIEVMKQAYTPTRRLATAALIDELSLGISIINGRTRIATEIGHFAYAATGKSELHPMQELVWTKLVWALGNLYPTMLDVSEDALFEIQKACFDEMWGSSLSVIVATVGDRWGPDTGLEDSAQRIDNDIKANAERLVSYQATYRDEIIGGLDAAADLAADVMAAMAERAGVVPPIVGSTEWMAAGREFRNLLIAAFDQPATKTKLRTIHSMASFHAGLRWNRQTTFNANHFFDFEHAAAAVSYCDAFFTDGFLTQIANARHVKLGELNGCQITSDVERAVEILKQARARP